MPSHPVQFLLKSVVVRGRGKLIKKITLGVRTAGVVNSGRCQGRIRWGGGDGDDESMMAATGVERQTKKKGGQQQRTAVYCERQRTEADVGGDVGGGRRQMSVEMLVAEMMGDGGESRGSGGAIAEE